MDYWQPGDRFGENLFYAGLALIKAGDVKR